MFANKKEVVLNGIRTNNSWSRRLHCWKKIFNKAAIIRKNAGEISYQVLKYPEEPNKTVHFSNWSSIDNAKAFFESPVPVKIRKEAGVKAPEFI